MTTKLLLLLALSLFQISQCVNLRSQTDLETKTELATQTKDNSLVQQTTSDLPSDQIYCIYSATWSEYASGVDKGSSYWVEGVPSCSADSNSAQWYLGTTGGGYYYLEWLGESSNYMSITTSHDNTVRFASSVGPWESLEIYQKPGGQSYEYCIYNPDTDAWAHMSLSGSAYLFGRTTSSCGAYETFQFFQVVS